MNLTIIPGKATEDVKEIESIVNSIDTCMKELDDKINKIIPEHLETKWANELKENWRKSYNNSIQSIMEAMLLSAKNLQNDVEAALEYSQS